MLTIKETSISTLRRMKNMVCDHGCDGTRDKSEVIQMNHLKFRKKGKASKNPYTFPIYTIASLTLKRRAATVESPNMTQHATCCQ